MAEFHQKRLFLMELRGAAAPTNRLRFVQQTLL